VATDIDDLTVIVGAKAQIRGVLDAPDFDILEAFRAGDLIVIRDCTLEADGEVRVEHLPPSMRWLLGEPIKGQSSP